ncbi:hypothetical protein FACS1894208_11200 [Clostridia bacterium]|nr:hypothetical protein FACS1894208_11200 [Clostridia bacterium]
MKINKIVSVFKKNKRVFLYTAPSGEQWVSNGAAVYRLEASLPKLKAENMLFFFDVPQDKRSEWNTSDQELPVDIIPFEDNYTDDEQSEPETFTIGFDGKDYLIFNANGQTIPFNEDFVKPFYGNAYTQYFIRKTHQERPALFIKVGFELQAVIMPSGIFDRPALTERICEAGNYLHHHALQYQEEHDRKQAEHAARAAANQKKTEDDT